MDSEKINLWVMMNTENFHHHDLLQIKDKMTTLSDDKFFVLQSMSFEKPNTMFLISLLLGWERFWLDDIALGVLKMITCQGCGIWWLIDLFTVKDRTKKYNYNKVLTFLNIY